MSDFPSSSPHLSNDNDIQTILADIPFFSVGILAFAVFTFCLAMKRVNLLATYLFASAFIAFLAAIIDLTNLLSQRRTTPSLKPTSATPRIIFREVFFSISVGLRFLFFWTFVATRPRAEPPTQIQHSTSILFARQEGYHTAAWSRWAVPGMILKWGLLSMTILIVALQIVWRTKGKGGPVYLVESTIEIVAAALFILKLLMNTWLSTATSVMKSLRGYAAPIVVLMLSMAISIANVASFEFSETTLGRFLQAVELYILLLFILIFSFSKRRNPSILIDSPTEPPKKPEYTDKSFRVTDWQTPSATYADKSFRGLADWQTRQSVFHIAPPRVSTPDAESITDPDPIQSQPNRRSSIQQNDPVSKLSTWKFKFPGGRRNSRTNREETLRVINLDDPESGYSIEEKELEVSPTSADEPGSALPYLSVEASAPQPNFTPIPQRFVNTRQSPVASQSTNALVAPQVPGPSTNVAPRPSESSSLTAYYGAAEPSPSFKPNGDNLRADSPVYGLDGVQAPSPASLHPERPRSSLISFNEMMRQQKELDKSIATLRLLSPIDMSFHSESHSTSSRENDEPAEASRASRSRSAATISASGRSEFSLSVFPDPPEENNGFPPTALAAMKLTRLEISRTADNTEQRPPTKMVANARRNKVPSSPEHVHVGSLDVPTAPGVRGNRLDSAGTQYDVTSFIGDLTGPGHVVSDSVTHTLSDAASTLSTPSVSILVAQRKPLPIRSSISLAVASRNPKQSEEASQEVLSPVSSTSSSTVTPSTAGLNARWAGRGGDAAMGLPPRPRLPKGGRQPSPPDGKRETPDIYERAGPSVLDTGTPKTTAPPGAF